MVVPGKGAWPFNSVSTQIWPVKAWPESEEEQADNARIAREAVINDKYFVFYLLLLNGRLRLRVIIFPETLLFTLVYRELWI